MMMLSIKKTLKILKDKRELWRQNSRLRKPRKKRPWKEPKRRQSSLNWRERCNLPKKLSKLNSRKKEGYSKPKMAQIEIHLLISRVLNKKIPASMDRI